MCDAEKGKNIENIADIINPRTAFCHVQLTKNAWMCDSPATNQVKIELRTTQSRGRDRESNEWTKHYGAIWEKKNLYNLCCVL